MRDMNSVTLIGSVGQDPELKTAPNGNPVLRCSMATNFRWKDKDGNAKERVEWHTLTLWEAAAEQFAATIRKGDRIFVKGAIHYGEYTRKDGSKANITEIRVEDFGKMTKPEKTGGEKSTGRGRPAQQDNPDFPF